MPHAHARSRRVSSFWLSSLDVEVQLREKMIDPRSPDPQRLVVRLILALASAVAFFSAGKVTKDLQGGYGNSSWCAHLSGVDESLFCASMTGSHRSHAVQEWIRAERECAWRQRSATKNDLSTYYTSSDLPSDLVFAASAPGIEDPLKGSIWSPDVLTIENATVTHCRVPVGDSVWTMERVGDFIGTGGAGLGSWHHAFYSDVGFFSREVKEGELYFTAFQFVPVNAATGERLGYPPARIHHMHVAADQLRRLTKEPPYNTFYAREGIFLFDVHGDRQCHASLGGVDCLMNAMPTGFGVKSSDVLETFVSINDARPSDSEVSVLPLKHACIGFRIATLTARFAPITIAAAAAPPHGLGLPVDACRAQTDGAYGERV